MSPPLLELAKSNTFSFDLVPPQVGVESAGGLYQIHTENAAEVNVKLGKLNDSPDTKFEDGMLLPLGVCEKFAALLPSHIPDVSVGGVADATKGPNGLGELSARKLALSKV